MCGLEQMPSRGQSTTWPPGSFSKTACHKYLPEASSNDMTTPKSTGTVLPVFGSFVIHSLRLSRGFSLLVPMKTWPLAMMGPP
jgi:hypothetical protein